jgi:TIR domain-containing protein
VKSPAGHVFISYVREDSHHIDRLQQTLEAAGVSVWRDKADLWPGEDWRTKIRRTITDNALVFLACFSSQSGARKKSYQNEELLLAIEQLRLRRPDDPWLIPVRFDDCDIPDLDIGGGRTLASIQWVDLFDDRRDAGIARLVRTILRILGQGPSASARWQPASPRINVGVADELEPKSAPPSPKENQRYSKPSYGSGTESVDAAVEFSTAGDPLPTVSGSNSKVLEIDLATGRYLVRWSKEGNGELYVIDETDKKGQGNYLVIGARTLDSGERVVRIGEGGRHLISVRGDHLDWSFNLTPI